MNLQGYRKLATSPSSSVGKSFTSLYSCLLPRAIAAPSLRSLIALSASFDHAPLLCPALGWRGFCWVRRAPPFPRNAAPKAALVQEFTCTEILSGLAGENHLRLTNGTLASAPAAIDDAFAGVHNVCATTINGAASLCEVSAAASGHVSFNNGTLASAPAAIGDASVAANNIDAATVNAAASPCEAGAAGSDAFRCAYDGNLNMANGPRHPRDINTRVPLAADCLIPQPCDTTTIGGIGAAPQSLTGSAAPPGLVESSVNFSGLSNATAKKETPVSQLAKAEGSKGPQLRRMLNSNHAVIRDLKDEKMPWFPYVDQFKLKDQVLTSTQIMQMLGSFMLEDRKDRIKRVVANRTYAICIVVEGLLDLGNIAAIFRSADALGFQSVQIISNETERRYKKNRKISMGSEKWLDAELFNITEDCFEELRSRGYRVAVASVTADSVPIFDMDWTIPTAVVFGNEYRGVSREALEMADLSCYIPMEGMVDSFNVSVAAGIVMHHAVNDRKARLGMHGDLSEEEQRILSADFYLRHSSRSLSVIDRMLQKKQEERQTDLRSVLMGDLELDIELPEYLKLDLEKVCTEFNSV